MKRFYQKGLDILGAEILGQETNRAILIKVNNASELARSQGSIATIAQKLAPATIEAKVLEEMAKQLKSSLADKNVEADVMVVEPKEWRAADGKHIAQDIAVGVIAAGGVVALLAIMWKGLSKKK